MYEKLENKSSLVRNHLFKYRNLKLNCFNVTVIFKESSCIVIKICFSAYDLGAFLLTTSFTLMCANRLHPPDIQNIFVNIVYFTFNIRAMTLVSG